jgi:hypothetical protein
MAACAIVPVVFTCLVGEIEDRDGFVRDIAYAIWRAPVRAARHGLAPAERDILAKAIADHLKLANWVIRKGEAPAAAWRRVRGRDLHIGVS